MRRRAATLAPTVPGEPPIAAPWLVYVLRSADGARTYVGITTDVDRRLAQHNGDLPGGARSTRHGRPWRVEALSPPLPDRSTALRLEHRVKRARGAARIRLVRDAAVDPVS